GEEYIFLTDIPDLFHLCYRLYHQVFDGFVYYEVDEERRIELKPVYQTIYELPIQEKELLYKDIYTNSIEIAERYRIKTLPLKNMIDCDELFECELESYNKYYDKEGKYYFFEPVRGKQCILISSNDRKGGKPDYTNIAYEYGSYTEFLNQIQRSVINFTTDPKQELINLDTLLRKLGESYSDELPFE
ncbi:MAG TPA: hypothetical protein VHQ24_00580, partial [Lachnospiraceae bacterium]|nr:hypothetical protein [Lachnospiraceae bacterium]